MTEQDVAIPPIKQSYKPLFYTQTMSTIYINHKNLKRLQKCELQSQRNEWVTASATFVAVEPKSGLAFLIGIAIPRCIGQLYCIKQIDEYMSSIFKILTR